MFSALRGGAAAGEAGGWKDEIEREMSEIAQPILGDRDGGHRLVVTTGGYGVAAAEPVRSTSRPVNALESDADASPPAGRVNREVFPDLK